MIYMPEGEDRVENLRAASSAPQALLWEVSR